jgi:hypothetical protein
MRPSGMQFVGVQAKGQEGMSKVRATLPQACKVGLSASLEVLLRQKSKVQNLFLGCKRVRMIDQQEHRSYTP